jgi:hypothetical protein
MQHSHHNFHVIVLNHDFLAEMYFLSSQNEMKSLVQRFQEEQELLRDMVKTLENENPDLVTRTYNNTLLPTERLKIFIEAVRQEHRLQQPHVDEIEKISQLLPAIEEDSIRKDQLINELQHQVAEMGAMLNLAVLERDESLATCEVKVISRLFLSF